MSLVVEDGTGLANAEAYASVATADAYHVAMGNAAWAPIATASKEAALRQATQYIDNFYRFRYCSLLTTQALQFPRNSGTTAAPIAWPTAWPVVRLVNACCELALRQATGTQLFKDQTGGEVIAETVGPISVQYAQAGLSGQTRFAQVDALLAFLTYGGRTSIRVERA